MNARILSRCISACLSLALLVQLGTVNAYAAYLEGPADEVQSMAVAEQSKWDQLKAELSQKGNPVSQYVNKFDKKEKTIIWVKGITPPTIGTDDAELQPLRETVNNMTYETYQTKYIPNRGWYDINKTGKGDTYLCFAVAASNSLHWWLDQNNKYVQQYIARNPDTPQMRNLKGYLNSFHTQENSGIFEYFKGTFGGRPNGYWPDLLQDHFLNGYPYKKDETVNVPGSDTPAPDENKGFFYDVFGSQLLSHRHKALNYEHDSDLIKKLLMEGNIIMPTFVVGQNSHVVTLWGAEYDLDGKISAIFLSDSDDGDVTQTNQAMKRYTVKRAKNGKALISTHAGEGGNELYLLNSLSLGEQYWKDYSASKQTLTLQWGDNSFDYDGKPHKPEVVAFSGNTPSDDVKIVTTGEKKDAGTFAATAEIQGADAGKYKLKPEERMHSFTIRPAEATVTVTADLNNYATKGTVKLRADVKGVNGEEPGGTITFFEGSQEIGTAWTGPSNECTWKGPSPGSHQIIAKFKPDQYGISKNYVESQSALTIIDIMDPTKKEQAPLVFEPIDGLQFGGADFTLSATGGSTQSEIQYSSSNPNVIAINGSTASIKGAGTTHLTATKPGDTDYNSVSKTIVVQVAKGDMPKITYPTASDLTYGQALAESQLTGGSKEFGSFAWENPSVVPGAGSTQQRVTFTPDLATEQNYEQITPLSQEVSVTVSQAAPTVMLNTEVKQNGADPVVVLTATVEQAGKGEAPSDGTVTFVDCTGGASAALPGAESVQIQNGIATFTWTGMKEGQYSIQAQFSGSANYTKGLSPVKQVDTTASVQKTYPICVENDGNGTAQASHSSASKGTEVTLTAVPNAGFQFKEWKVLTGQVTLSGNMFIMPDMPVSIQAIFEKQDDSAGGGGSGGGSGGSSGGSNSGGGGSSHGSAQTNPDGSVTTVDKTTNGSVVTTTKYPDGSSSKVEVKKDGGSISTNTTANGTVGKVAKDAAGNITEISGQVSDQDAQQAKENGEPVKVPVKVGVSSSSNQAPSVKLELPQGGAAVEIPVDHLTAGTVAILVRDDGKEEILKRSGLTKDGVMLNLETDATIKLVDNSKTFHDVQGSAWYKDAVDFMSARELVEGTSEAIFNPEASLSRSMLAMILYNLEDKPTVGQDSGFSDVMADSWYADAINWATKTGIIVGYDNGTVGPNHQITREQIAVMLYRYAGSPTSNQEVSGFVDGDAISDFAKPAMNWAVERGVIGGKDGGKLDPKGQATRAEAVQMMMNFMT